MISTDVFSILIPDHSLLELAISLMLCVFLGFYSYWRQILDLKGATASFIVGLVIAIFANIYWLITLIGFLMVTYFVTKLDFSYKKVHGVAQGRFGERSIINVIANGSIPMVIVIFRFQLGYPLTGLLFITSISVAASDSFANEIGVLSNKTYLITNLHKRVRPGTDGGISKLGQAAALIGAFIPALLGWILISEFNNNLIQVTDLEQMPMTATTLLLPIIMGFIGCQIDSLLGATLQRRKLISNDDVNFLSVLISIFILLVIVLLEPIKILM
jgi:uncharacterized protein (TIGR00297 family)